jgi:hypothetical protein
MPFGYPTQHTRIGIMTAPIFPSKRPKLSPFI